MGMLNASNGIECAALQREMVTLVSKIFLFSIAYYATLIKSVV